MPTPGKGKTLFVGVEELGEMAVRFTDLGEVVFFNTRDGAIVDQDQLMIPAAYHLDNGSWRPHTAGFC